MRHGCQPLAAQPLFKLSFLGPLVWSCPGSKRLVRCSGEDEGERLRGCQSSHAVGTVTCKFTYRVLFMRWRGCRPSWFSGSDHTAHGEAQSKADPRVVTALTKRFVNTLRLDPNSDLRQRDGSESRLEKPGQNTG